MSSSSLLARGDVSSGVAVKVLNCQGGCLRKSGETTPFTTCAGDANAYGFSQKLKYRYIEATSTRIAPAISLLPVFQLARISGPYFAWMDL